MNIIFIFSCAVSQTIMVYYSNGSIILVPRLSVSEHSLYRRTGTDKCYESAIASATAICVSIFPCTFIGSRRRRRRAPKRTERLRETRRISTKSSANCIQISTVDYIRTHRVGNGGMLREAEGVKRRETLIDTGSFQYGLLSIQANTTCSELHVYSVSLGYLSRIRNSIVPTIRTTPDWRRENWQTITFASRGEKQQKKGSQQHDQHHHQTGLKLSAAVHEPPHPPPENSKI